MKKHDHLLTIVLAGAILPITFAAPKPNILLILVDDMGYSDLGCFGSEIKTPNIDRLAEKGIKFTHFTNCAKCESSRASLMAGRYHVEPEVYSGKRVITIPENLALAGYQSFALGKWHIFDTPTKRGFDRYFGFLEGASNFFTGEGTGGTFSYRLDDKEFNDFPDDFYSTVAFTDYGIKFIDERNKEKPFFMYMAYNAPHYPLQAPKEEVMKYKGKYMDGWQVLRDKRYTRMQELGIVGPDTGTPGDDWKIGGWENQSQERKEDMDLRMATYAAMIDIVDQQVGRIVEKLKADGIYDDTLIIFLSDNGACPFDRTRKETKENNWMPWDGRSYWCYPDMWARACNTPFKGLKQSQYEGGISTPLIAHWPDGITVPGTMNRQRGHLVDLHATFRELAGVEYPSNYDWKTGKTEGPDVGPARGISLVPAFAGARRPEHPFLYQNFSNGKTALVRGDWKLVNYRELYKLDEDRMEGNDLSTSMPERFAMMQREFKGHDVAMNEGRAMDKTEEGRKALVRDWLVLGPFEDLSDQGDALFEPALDPVAEWTPFSVNQHKDECDLKKQFGDGNNRSAFLKTTLTVPESTRAVMQLKGSDRVIAMLNGTVVNGHENAVTLQKGQEFADFEGDRQPEQVVGIQL